MSFFPSAKFCYMPLGIYLFWSINWVKLEKLCWEISIYLKMSLFLFVWIFVWEENERLAWVQPKRFGKPGSVCRPVYTKWCLNSAKLWHIDHNLLGLLIFAFLSCPVHVCVTWASLKLWLVFSSQVSSSHFNSPEGGCLDTLLLTILTFPLQPDHVPVTIASV